jgi:hypothetical protein
MPVFRSRSRRRAAAMRAAACAAVVGAGLSGGMSAGAAPARPTSIAVDPGDAQGYISPDIFGVIDNWTYDAAGTYDARTQQWVPQFVALARQAGLTSVRFFGGTLSGKPRCGRQASARFRTGARPGPTRAGPGRR